MTIKSTEKNLRDRYFSNEIFCIGDIVEDVTTGEHMKILDRGSNYVTVATNSGIIKKWLNEVKEDVRQETLQIIEEQKIDKDFELLESGQIKLFGYDTKNFDADLSELLIEQFSEFSDLYSKHQIVKCLDFALQESDADRSYDLLDKVESFCNKQNITTPFIVEALKNDIERTRIANILATVAEVTPSKNNTQTIKDTIDALKEKYKTRQQWEVLYPFFQIAKDAGLIGATNTLPFNIAKVTEDFSVDDIIIDVIEDHITECVDELTLDDVYDTFLEEEYSDDMLSEVLSIETRQKMSRKIHQHAPTMNIRKERALKKSASTSVIMDRARRLAETLLKRRIFHKSPADMTRQEKERFESGASKRKALVARLAQKLVGKVRGLQSARLHHTATPASTNVDKAAAHISAASGAS
jgi:hypothetical protein